MDLAAIDIPALVLAIVIAAIITVALMIAHRGDDQRRGWITAGALAAALTLLSLLDLMRASPRQTHLVTAVFGGALPVLCALGMVRATRQVRAWVRWPLVFLTALIFLFAGVLIGAALVPRLMG